MVLHGVSLTKAVGVLLTSAAAAAALIAAASCSSPGGGSESSEPLQSVQQSLNSITVYQDPSGSQTINQPDGSALFVNRFGAVRYAAQFPGSPDVGTQIANAIADLPATGGIVDATGYQGTALLQSDMFRTANGRPGKIIFGDTLFATSATQNVPSNWEIVGAVGGVVNGSHNGTTFYLEQNDAGAPATNVVLNYFDTAFTKTTGITIDCRGFGNMMNACNKESVTMCTDNGVVGFQIYGDNNTNTPSTSNMFENIAAITCACGMTWGAASMIDGGPPPLCTTKSVVPQCASDGIIVRNFTFTNNTCGGLVVNSQNAGQDSILERGSITMSANSGAGPDSGTDQDGIILAASPLNFSIRSVTIGNTSTNNGAAIHAILANGSGGQPLKIDTCEFEMNMQPVLQVDSTSGLATYVMTGNSYSGAAKQTVVSVAATQNHVVSIGNSFWSGTGSITAANSGVVSIGDMFNPDAGWTVAAGSRLINMDNWNGTSGGNASLGGQFALTSADTSGTQSTAGSCPACGGSPCYQVSFANPYSAAPRVMLTPQSQAGNFWATSVTGAGFTMCTSQAASVSYAVVATQ